MKKWIFGWIFVSAMVFSIFFLNLIFYIRTLNYPQELQKNILEILKNQMPEDNWLGVSECKHEQYRFYISYVKNNETMHRYYSVDWKLYQEFKFNTSWNKEYKKEVGTEIIKLYKEGNCWVNLKKFTYRYRIFY